jgi:tripartite-type tricarboxylate transporter receptor subunit TctC
MGCFALVVPAGTDPAIMNKQSRDLATILGRPDLQKKFVDLATYTRPMSPGEASEFIRSQQQMWKPVLTQVVARSRQ